MFLLKLSFAVTVSFVLIFSHLACGQFPAACTDNANNGIKVCCPLNCSGPDHGTCESIVGTESADWSSIQEPGSKAVEQVNQVGEAFGKIDTRYQWPMEVFTNVCVCLGNYAGPDCSECDFGYEMDSNGNCQKRSSLRERKSITALSEQERMDLIMVLNESKNEHPSNYKWAVIVEEPSHATRSGLRLENVATYDMFVYQHSFSKRDGDVKDNAGEAVCSSLSDVDFGHEGPTFLTWHRYYLLIVERELGRIAERLGSPNGWNRYTFALPYWDWNDSDEVKNEIFSRSYFGTFDFDPESNRTAVEGVLFDDNNWPTVCAKHYDVNVDHTTPVTCSDIRRVCDPNTDRSKTQLGRLERGRFLVRGREKLDNRSLPVLDTIKYLLNTNQYDAEVIGMKDHYTVNSAGNSFRNRLEGFVAINEMTGEFAESGSGPTHNHYHNAVHIYIHGHMRIVPSASNDPIFYLHHANVDRVFESWFQGCGRGTTYVPKNISRVAHPGHNSQDYLVPFFPLKTNYDMYKVSNEFGYTYQELEQAANCPGPGGKCSSDNI